MAELNYTTGATQDVPGKLTVNPFKIDFAALDRDDESYHSHDFGVDFFETEFSHEFEWQVDAMVNGHNSQPWALANTLDDGFGIFQAIEDLFKITQAQSGGVVSLTIGQIINGSITNATAITGLSKSTLYYLTASRTLGGAFGDLTLDVFTDSARTILFGTSSFALTKDFKFQYYYPIQAWNSGNNGLTASGFVQNTVLNGEPVPPPPPPTPVPSPVPAITTHNQDAKNRLLEQYKKEPGIEGLIESYFGNQIQDLEDVLQLFFDRLNISISEGVQLNGIGRIINQDRLGLTDELYRLFIRGRIGANVSEGDIERLIEVWQTITQANLVKLEEIFPAEVNLATDVALPDNLIDIAFALIQNVSGAGIGVGITTFLPEDAFAFDGADPAITKGFGKLIEIGTTTATISFRLKDATALFITNGVDGTMLAMNDTAKTQANILSVVSESELILDADIFTTGQDYYINANTGGKLAKIQGAA